MKECLSISNHNSYWLLSDIGLVYHDKGEY